MKVIVIASGKGGTGKTSLTAGVASALAEMGKRVLAIDGDSGLRNLDLALGMSDSVVFTFEDVAKGVVSLETGAAAHPAQQGLYLLTAPIAEPALSENGMRLIADQAGGMGFDYLLIDGPAGLTPEIRMFSTIATQGIVVSTAESASLRGAERVTRMLEEEHIMRIRLVVNRVRPQMVYHQKLGNIDDAMDCVGLPLLGVVPEDETVIACCNNGVLLTRSRRSPAAQACRNIARRLEGSRVPLMKL